MQGGGAVNMKGHLVPYLVALVIFSGGFVLLDLALMNMQGLSLIFQP
jgi:hypothetical protein